MAKRVYEGLAITSRTFSHFVDAWNAQATGKPIYPQRKLRALFNSARGKTAGVFGKFYELASEAGATSENAAKPWTKFLSSDDATEINIARKPPSPPPADPSKVYVSPSGITCARMNKYGFYPIIVDDRDRTKVIHSCIDHAPSEVWDRYIEERRATRIAEVEKQQTNHEKSARTAAAAAIVDKEIEEAEIDHHIEHGS